MNQQSTVLHCTDLEDFKELAESFELKEDLFFTNVVKDPLEFEISQVTLETCTKSLYFDALVIVHDLIKLIPKDVKLPDRIRCAICQAGDVAIYLPYFPQLRDFCYDVKVQNKMYHAIIDQSTQQHEKLNSLVNTQSQVMKNLADHKINIVTNTIAGLNKIQPILRTIRKKLKEFETNESMSNEIRYYHMIQFVIRDISGQLIRCQKQIKNQQDILEEIYVEKQKRANQEMQQSLETRKIILLAEIQKLNLAMEQMSKKYKVLNDAVLETGQKSELYNKVLCNLLSSENNK